MNVTVEEISSINKKINIEIPLEQVTKEIESFYQQVGKQAKIKGFRPGKIPRDILERHFKDYVKSEVIQKLIHPPRCFDDPLQVQAITRFQTFNLTNNQTGLLKLLEMLRNSRLGQRNHVDDLPAQTLVVLRQFPVYGYRWECPGWIWICRGDHHHGPDRREDHG